MGLAGTTTRYDAERQLTEWIERGELTAQIAPANHPIYPALDRAREAVALLQDEDAAVPETIAAGTEIYDTIDRVIDGLISASVEVRNDGASPLPRTPVSLIAAPKQDIPWGLIAAGGGVLVVGWYLFRRQARRRS